MCNINYSFALPLRITNKNQSTNEFKLLSFLSAAKNLNRIPCIRSTICFKHETPNENNKFKINISRLNGESKEHAINKTIVYRKVIILKKKNSSLCLLIYVNFRSQTKTHFKYAYTFLIMENLIVPEFVLSKVL